LPEWSEEGDVKILPKRDSDKTISMLKEMNLNAADYADEYET
jgi:hypothetical protein